ncbi:hypothetical protein FUT28_12165 [Enterococcus durans]|nr:hypothetical protein [Enterococcus durans]QED60562.1 hypothetical protein FS851_12530 [Enterococcus durans]QED63107.1 hypothetical protein FUT28_12165 [Enterococcus durans]
MKKINSNLVMFILTVVIWISFLSIEWKVILSAGTMIYLFCSWDVYVVEELPSNCKESLGNLHIK